MLAHNPSNARVQSDVTHALLLGELGGLSWGDVGTVGCPEQVTGGGRQASAILKFNFEEWPLTSTFSRRL